jgi:CRP-like cAMP-binding protein
MPFLRSRSRVDPAGLTRDQHSHLVDLVTAVEKAPHDLKARKALADQLRAVGRHPDAIEQYQAIAGAYAAQGLLFRAISVCKQILTLDPTHQATRQALADLYAQKDAQSGEHLQAELPPALGGALTVDDDDVIVEESSTTPPLPSSPDGAPINDAEVVGIDALLAGTAELDDDDHGDGDGDDVVDASTLAALTVLPHGSISLPRPQAVPLFSGLSSAAFEELVTALRAWEADAGCVVVGEGEDGDSLFVLARGRVRVERLDPETGEAVVLSVLEAGSFFGEQALLARRPRTASVIAETRAELLEMSRDVFEAMAQKDPGVRAVVEAFCTRRLVENVLRTSPLFAGLSAGALEETMNRFAAQTVAPGQVIITQGDLPVALGIVLLGAVDVVAKAEIGSLRLKQLLPGDVFGEMSLLTGAPATASVLGALDGEARVLLLPPGEVRRLLEDTAELQERLDAVAASRAAFNKMFLPATDVARSAGV